LNQSLPPDGYEIIVVDNGSTDDTRAAMERIQKRNGTRVRYVHENRPGLHNGRHRGFGEARGEILVFADDDIIATPMWLESILKSFTSDDVALVGGKILPKWEGEVPDWISVFKKETEFGWVNGYLSLLDFGNAPQEIPGKYVFGCNFSIRRNVLTECGGFHPDGMPQDLIQYRGDGETALANTVQARGYKIMYEPKAVIYHCVPPERLTEHYFCRRAFNIGISESYTEIRHQHGLDLLPLSSPVPKSTLIAAVKKMVRKIYLKKRFSHAAVHPIRQQVAEARKAGKSFHQDQVAHDKKILYYVLQKTYF
jgi:GT2 family glycosyltransferase